MKEMVTTTAAAKLLGVSTTSVKRWADADMLPCVRTSGGHRRFPRAALLAFGGTGPGDLPIAASEGLRDDLHRRLATMTRPQLDQLLAGVIQLDDAGIVLLYNRAESKFSGLAPEAVLGRHMFGDVAPCTNNALVWGRFAEGVASGRLDARIAYTFSFRMRPTNVHLHLYRDPTTRTNWLIVRQSAIVGSAT